MIEALRSDVQASMRRCRNAIHEGGRHVVGRNDPKALLRAYHRTGDEGARERLVQLYLPLVRALAQRYSNCGESRDDLVQVGSIGQIQAIERFDPERGSDFASFAIPTITGEIKNHLRDRSTAVRVPRRLAELSRNLRTPRDRLTTRLCRAPTLSELACEAGVGEDDVADALETERARTPVPLTTDGDTGPANGSIAVEGFFESSDDRLLLAAGFRTLAERERRILHLRFFAGLSQAEIAAEVGLSQIQVSRLIRSSLERMRGALATSDEGTESPKSLVSL
jgi:RNA polymerase sigma-B factor